MKTAVIYARYSSASQTEQSIEGQLHVCTQYAKANDLIVVDTYIDRATTGTNDNRAAFQQMLKDSENAAWEVVLVYAIDRFGRNSVEVALNKQRLKTNGKVLISATQRTSDNLDGTKNLDGILLENVYIGIAEYYSAELSQKILRGLRESRRKGQFCGGKIPYGYYVTDKKVQVDEEKAEVVRFIFRQYAAGVYVPKIICKLNEKGLLHNGKPFLPNAIYGILRNERYLGIMRIRDEVYDNIYPQIVDADLYEKVKRKLIKNKIGSRSVKEVYLLRNKVKCGYCGNIISAECGTARNGETIRYYKCLGRKKHHNGCDKHPVRKEALEELVLDSVIEAMQDEKTMNALIKGLMQMQDANNKEKTTLKLLLKEKKQTQTALDNIVKAIERGIMSDSTNRRLNELEQQARELDEKIAVERNKVAFLLTEDDMRRYYLTALRQEPQLLISTLVKEILLYDDKMVITYNTPLHEGSDDDRGFSFYERLCHNKQLINSHFYRGVSELPYKLLFAVIYTHLEFRYEMSHTITSHHVHHFHQTRIPDGTLLDYMVQYRKPLFPQFFLYPKKFLPENNPHHKEFHLRPHIQNNANQ